MARVPIGPSPPRCWSFEITLRHTTLGRTHLDEWSAHRRDIYLTKYNTHKRQTFMPRVGFEPMIPATQRPQTHALDCAATGNVVWWIRGGKEFDSRKFPEGSYSVLLHKLPNMLAPTSFLTVLSQPYSGRSVKLSSNIRLVLWFQNFRPRKSWVSWGGGVSLRF